jgi:hypothetical protein
MITTRNVHGTAMVVAFASWIQNGNSTQAQVLCFAPSSKQSSKSKLQAF